MALPQEVTTTELSRLFAVSAKTVAAWANAGIVTRVGRGRFNLGKSIRAVVRHHKRTTQQMTVVSAVGAQRERLLRAQADKAEMALKLEEDELCRVSEMRNATLQSFYRVRSGVMASTARISNRLPHMSRTDLVEISAELREALTGLAEHRYADDTAWTVRPAELAQQIGTTVQEVDRLAKAGVLPQPDAEGRLSLWGSVRALVALAARKEKR